MSKEKIAETIISMEREALSSRNEKLYQQTIGFIKGLQLSGVFQAEFENILLNEFKEEWRTKKETMRERLCRMWRMTA